MKKPIAAGAICLLMAVTAQAASLRNLLLTSEKALWAGWGAKDGQLYKASFTLDAWYIIAGAVPIRGRDLIASEVANNICTRENFRIENVSMRELGIGAIELSYDAFQTGECDGTPLPAKVRATSVYVKQGALWMVTLFQETAVELE